MNENEQNNEIMPADAAAVEENQEAIDQPSDNEETSDNEPLMIFQVLLAFIL